MTRRTGAVEHHLALLFELGQLTVWIRERCRARDDGVGQRVNARRREQCLLEGREIIEHVGRRLDRDLRVRDERSACLFLQRPEPRIVLIAALTIRSDGIEAHDWYTRGWRPDRRHAIGTGDRDIVHRHNRSPEINERLISRCALHRIRRGTCGRVDQPDVGRQRHRDANQPVLHQVREVGRPVAVDAEVVGVDRPEERIVRVLVVGQLRQ